MITREIPREEWIRFFNDFSKKHEGWVINLEVVGSDIGDQVEAELHPLLGITADVKGGENRIEIIVGGRPDDDLNRIIEKPQRVWYRHIEGEARDAIDIESEDGTKTLLQFRYIPPAKTERQLPESA